MMPSLVILPILFRRESGIVCWQYFFCHISFFIRSKLRMNPKPQPRIDFRCFSFKLYLYSSNSLHVYCVAATKRILSRCHLQNQLCMPSIQSWVPVRFLSLRLLSLQSRPSPPRRGRRQSSASAGRWSKLCNRAWEGKVSTSIGVRLLRSSLWSWRPASPWSLVAPHSPWNNFYLGRRWEWKTTMLVLLHKISSYLSNPGCASRCNHI